MTGTTALLLYLVFALGGAGVYLLLPKPGRSQALSGAVIGVLAVIGLLTVVAVRMALPEGTAGYYYVFAAITVLSAARVITHPKPVYSALYFVLVVVAVAALLVLQQAEFLAIAVIIVYAGAILVTYLFVLMLAHQPGSPVYDRRSREPLLSVLVGFVLLAAIAGRAAELPQAVAKPAPGAVILNDTGSASGGPAGNTSLVGAAVMTKYVVVLELAGVLLLISMIGAIALSRKDVPVETFAAAGRPLGQIGREVPPY
jgi:NADH-quinone oxidoreductase subunit J